MVNLTNLNEEPSWRNKRSLADKYNIPISFLDFDYIRKCSNGIELEKILLILLSGEEGHYPALIKETEDRLKVIKPNSKHIRKATPVIPKEYLEKDDQNNLDEDLQKWLESTVKNEEEINGNKSVCTSNNIPQIRANKIFTEPGTKPAVQKIKSTDYSSWDKYDADTEILKMDLKVEQLKQKLGEQETLLKTAEKNISSCEFLTQAEATFEANNEREKGNDYYKAGDYEEALKCYTNSILFVPSAANYNNRALAYIKLNKFKEAIQDCETTLKYEPQNVKALSRLAQSYDALKNYEKALQVSKVAIRLSPNSKFLQNLLSKLYAHFGNNPKKTRLKITEIEESNERNRVNNLKNKLNTNKPVLLPIPGPSHMPEPYYIKLKSNDPNYIKQQEYIMAYRSNNVIHRVIIDSTNDYDCTEIHILKPDSKFLNTKTYSNHMRKTSLTYNNNYNYNEVNSFSNKLMNINIDDDEYYKELEKVKCIENKLRNIAVGNNNTGTKSNIKPKRNVYQALNQKGGGGEPHIENDVFRVNHRDINTPFGFLKLWRSVENDASYIKQAELLRNLNINNLNRIIGYKLDGSMLGKILLTLYQHFSVPSEIDFVHNMLEALTRAPRFSLVVMFLDGDDRGLAKNLFQFLRLHGKPLPDNIQDMYS